MAHVNSFIAMLNKIHYLGSGASGLGAAVREIGWLSILGLVLLEINHVP